MRPPTSDLSALRRAAFGAARRVWFNRWLGLLARWLPWVFAYAAVALSLVKLSSAARLQAPLLLGVGVAASFFLVAATAWWSRVRTPEAEGALLLDNFHRTKGRLSNALAFWSIPKGSRSVFMELAIEDATRSHEALAPAKAVPLERPQGLGWILLSALALAASTVVELRPAPPAEPEVAEGAQEAAAALLAPDDLEYFGAKAAELEARTQDEATRGAIQRFNQLIVDLAEGRVDKEAAFRRLEALERELSRTQESEPGALEEALKERARALQKSALSRKVADALEQQDIDEAERRLRELAAKVREQSASKRDLEHLQRALKAASEKSEEARAAIEQRRSELARERQRLLQKKSQEKGQANSDTERRLEQNSRKLERLEREKQQSEAASQELSQLDRELAEAARKLMEEAGLSADDLERGAEQLNRQARRSQSDREKEELKQQLEAMRELLRQQGGAGKEQLQRLLRFGHKARGEGGPKEPGSEPGRPAGEGSGQGKPGSAQVVPGGGQVPLPTGSPQADGKPGGEGKPSAGKPDPGSSAGTGHEAAIAGEATSLEGQTKDVAARAEDTGEGTASAEVIEGAAARGFMGRGYRRVYTDYKTVAEEVMARDEVPPGYRFYVRRYFQLIRPRD